jgi:alanyl-tRNA synthetase
MNSRELRKKFLNFFEKRGHKIVPSSSLIPTDPSVLFTTAGMQQFKPYYLGEPSPYGPNVASCQKCFRTSDIDNVGITPRHLTFFEMLGNFSFGGYFKEEAIKFALEFLIEDCKLQIDRMKFTYFKGDKETPEDIESKKILLKLGIEKEKIIGMGKEDNFWGPTGLEGPCGPTTEIHIDGIEVWNLVFNEYYKDREGKLTPLKQKGVDTGMGLERLAMISQNKNSVFETDLFEPIIKLLSTSNIEHQTSNIEHRTSNIRSQRIIADHIKGSVFLISEGILPSNVERGYVLRRILRRAILHSKILNLPRNSLIEAAKKVIEIYKDVYPEVLSNQADILTVIEGEKEKFEKTLEKGLKNLKLQISNCKLKNEKILPGKIVFDLFQSYGFPFEITREVAKEEGLEVDEKDFKERFKKHQEISRVGAEKKFGGLGKVTDYNMVKLHTATHLLHAALREILGEKVRQMGSDITPQRLRFDFSFDRKLTKEEIKKVEDLVNQKIKEDLEVKREEMSLKDALKSGALAFFKDKYPERVTVYTIGNFSKEICAGPHVKRTSELGSFKIEKEESVQRGIRRIYAILLK